MHEMAIMDSALNLALEQARAKGAARIHVLQLRVGDLSGVVPEALEFAFEALALGTEAEGAALQIERVPARFWCHTCRREFAATDLFSECPDCHQPSGDLRSGREMELTSMEIA